jgi:hypothetical protein
VTTSSVTFEGTYTCNSGTACAFVEVVITPDGGEPTTLTTDELGAITSTEIDGESFTVSEQISHTDGSSVTQTKRVRAVPGQSVDLSRDVGFVGSLVGVWRIPWIQ